MAHSLNLTRRVALETGASGGLRDMDELLVLLASGGSYFVHGAVVAADDGFAD